MLYKYGLQRLYKTDSSSVKKIEYLPSILFLRRTISAMITTMRTITATTTPIIQPSIQTIHSNIKFVLTNICINMLVLGVTSEVPDQRLPLFPDKSKLNIAHSVLIY